MQKIRVGVAGAGAFGRNHVRKLLADAGAEVSGVYDRSGEGRAAAAAELGVTTADSLEALINASDAIVVATPAVSHAEIATAVLQAGKHCLIEKPLAATTAESQALVRLADDNRLVLQAGHQERYVFGAMGLWAVKEAPARLHAAREGLPGPRGTDVSVTLDLMVHDLDLVRRLFRAEPVSVSARHLAGELGCADAIEADLVFPGGRRATLVASRVAELRRRTMSVDYKAGRLDIDFVARSFKDGAGLGLHADFAERMPDAMAAATADFLAAIRGEKPVAISGADGAAAVALAEKIDQVAVR
jgi:predicted dehydrogenase